ncbi:Detected protein of unknown function [Hibiscus syriacus]|uniref:Uncharacterized protein n=1 Tax=Hibiscus syriacus TaxID=106335 RepID=A0A6A2XZQ8_HIBSY|nr:uncharacterized protein LOC120171265 [Hibiscus syriacus]KAE8673005.1 Detected protein of unknown function [Hibiscus syriacus]
MARTNKYTSINFNHVIEKNLTSSSSFNKNPQSQSSFASYSSASNVKTHGRMLVLTRPSPKPVSTPPVVSPTLPKHPEPRSSLVLDQHPSSDQISLRPGSGISITGPEKKEKEGVFVSGSAKSGRFVPPHLRPGFAGREEKPEPKVFLGREQGVKHFGSLGHYGEDMQPESGGYEKIKIGGESDLGLIPRPRSSGSRPSSSGRTTLKNL